METTEKKIPTYVLEDRLFARRLHRNLNEELERLHHLLTEQVRLLKERDALMSKVHAAVQQRWEKEVHEEVARVRHAGRYAANTSSVCAPCVQMLYERGEVAAIRNGFQFINKR